MWRKVLGGIIKLINASFERLQCLFTTYFKKTERKLRWDFQFKIQNVKAMFDTLVNKPVGEGGRMWFKQFSSCAYNV